MKFKIYRATYKSGFGQPITQLISQDSLKEKGVKPKDFFLYAKEIEKLDLLGEVEMIGDDHLLRDSYIENP